MAAAVDHKTPGFGDLEPASNAKFPVPRCNSFRSASFKLKRPAEKSLTIDDEDSSFDGDQDQNSYYRDLIRKGKDEIEPSILDPRDEGTADSGIMRNPSMIRLTGKHPFNSEPPLDHLMRHGFITPAPLHYVRNHGPVPKTDWASWTIDVTGLVQTPTSFTLDQLITGFRSVEFPVTIMCSGNRRKEQNMMKQTIGFHWGAAVTSTSLWRGVPLREVLKRCGIFSRQRGALYVWMEGGDDLPGGGGCSYGTSIRREMAMDPSRDIIIAYKQNGEDLPPDHGFPVRMIVPGFTGGRMVKWLKRIIVTNRESDNYYHFMDNRVLPSHVLDSELANAEGWWYKPEYVIYEMNINSVITTPSHDETLTINAQATQTTYTLRGYAFSGGGKKVTRVQVTLDGGETWRMCNLEYHEKPNKYGKYWCWIFWSVEVEIVDLFRAKEIAVRAWDETNNTQPENLNWNLMGMMNNSWYRIKINICKPQKGEIGIVFRHPTLAGNQSGGWKEKEKEKNQTDAAPGPTKNTIPSSKTFSMSEVKTHNSPESAWIVVHGHVYDCTPFLKDHPGGADSILINAGTDCTEEFDAIHSDKAKNMLEDYRIGDLLIENNSSPSPIKELTSAQTPSRHVALVPREKIPVKLVSKTSISHNTRVFRFALPCEDQILGLPVGKHIFLCATVDGKLCMRAYTPSSAVDQVGYFDLVVKVYFKNVHPNFPNGGLMSQYLDSLPLGSVVDVKGPLGHIEYMGRGNFMVHGKPTFAKKLAMVAGGTGITPIYQVVQAILKDPEDETEMFVVYANRTEEDILLREELDAWAEKHEKLKIWHVVKEGGGEGWPYSVGYITEGILREHIPAASPDTLALVCGPPPMIELTVKPILKNLEYDTESSLLVF
ncbi:nitrate reductase [NADH]-like isoform X2 [Momordica charantia]|uniref:Nitrate reductase n=1 Tax=Momordica charantia TaxID=3673 RepID=A0A6J1CIG4_MOMCH|nr:nitrate reductase [NADH]-like isoform X2 [Momordica charantia]